MKGAPRRGQEAAEVRLANSVEQIQNGHQVIRTSQNEQSNSQTSAIDPQDRITVKPWLQGGVHF
jgi:hypothetical protein